MKIDEITRREKAGIIPYYIDSDIIKMLFMIPSNPAYGGTSPQIAKGGVDRGEDVKQGALREGNEELGLLQSNIKLLTLVGTKLLTGLDETYNFTVYVAEIKDPKAFTSTDHETGRRLWLTPEEFMRRGRSSQKQFVQLAVDTINSL